MNALLINQLVSLQSVGPPATEDEERLRFADRYSSPAYGMSVARYYRERSGRFPMVLVGRDAWVYRAYLHLRSPADYYNTEIADATALAHPQNKLGTKIRGLLTTCCGMDPKEALLRVSAMTSIPYTTISAFETLYYNILDRASDGAYLSELIYPMTRIVEMAEDYMRNAKVGDLLQRAGYNTRNYDLVSYLAGFGDGNFAEKLAGMPDSEEKVTKALFAHGVLLTHTGALASRAPGIGRTTALIAASRQAGGQTAEHPFEGLADGINDDFEKAVGLSRQTTKQVMMEDEGLIDVEEIQFTPV